MNIRYELSKKKIFYNFKNKSLIQLKKHIFKLVRHHELFLKFYNS